MAGNDREGGASVSEQFIGNLVVDALDDGFRKQQFNVEFAFLCSTTVNTVLDDLEDALKGMNLRLAIPRDQCALAYDRSRNNSHYESSYGNDIQTGRDGCVVTEEAHAKDNENIAILSEGDSIFKVPEVEAFYDLNRRCGLSRIATFFLVKKTMSLLPSRSAFSTPKEKKKHLNDDDRSAANSLSVYLLPRNLQFDKLSKELLASANDEVDNRNSASYQDALKHVREMVAAAEKSILTSRQQQYIQYPHRGPHWSVQLNRPPSRLEWLRAVEAEAAAYDRLTAKFEQNTTEELRRQEAANRALEEEVAQLHQRIDGVKINVTKRQALQERSDQLKIEIEAQRKKEQELLQALEREKNREIRQDSPQPGGSPSFRLHADHLPPPPPPPPPGTLPSIPPPFSSSALLAQHDGHFLPQHQTFLHNESGPNYSAIHGITSGTDNVTGSHLLSPSLREEVRRALSPRGTSPMSAQQQQQQHQQPKLTDLNRLRHLAAELSHHLRLPNPDPGQRQRLMEEIRVLRRQVEQQQAEHSRVSSGFLL